MVGQHVFAKLDLKNPQDFWNHMFRDNKTLQHNHLIASSSMVMEGR